MNVQYKYCLNIPQKSNITYFIISTLFCQTFNNNAIFAAPAYSYMRSKNGTVLYHNGHRYCKDTRGSEPHIHRCSKRGDLGCGATAIITRKGVAVRGTHVELADYTIMTKTELEDEMITICKDDRTKTYREIYDMVLERYCFNIENCNTKLAFVFKFLIFYITFYISDVQI